MIIQVKRAKQEVKRILDYLDHIDHATCPTCDSYHIIQLPATAHNKSLTTTCITPYTYLAPTCRKQTGGQAHSGGTGGYNGVDGAAVLRRDAPAAGKYSVT
jgi:hypothetical protein